MIGRARDAVHNAHLKLGWLLSLEGLLHMSSFSSMYILFGLFWFSLDCRTIGLGWIWKAECKTQSDNSLFCVSMTGRGGSSGWCTCQSRPIDLGSNSLMADRLRMSRMLRLI